MGTYLEAGQRPEIGKMGGNPVGRTINSPEGYRTLLRQGQLPEAEVERLVGAKFSTTVTVGESNTVTMKISKTALCTCEAARAAGFTESEISKIMESAMVAAIGERRKKIGMFGRAGEIIKELGNQTTERRFSKHLEGVRGK